MVERLEASLFSGLTRVSFNLIVAINYSVLSNFRLVDNEQIYFYTS